MKNDENVVKDNQKGQFAMPKQISPEHMNRMFPFEFFDELQPKIKNQFVLYNPLFLIETKASGIPLSKPPFEKEKRKEIFEESRKQTKDLHNTLYQHNILDIEPFGELLMIDLCCKREHLDIVLNKRNGIESQLPLCLLAVQLYDSANLPVFASDVTEDTIEKIPEVLWDDPNLLISVLCFEEHGAELAVLKIPEAIESHYLEEKRAGE